MNALPTPANDNANPLDHPATALLELFRLRRKVIEKNMTGFSPVQWRRRYEVLDRLDKAIGLLQPYL
jgi:hypothetical protein